MPTKEMEEEASRERPYANKKIVVVSGSKKIACVRTDTSGKIDLKLKPGTYRLFEEWRYYKQLPAKLPAKGLDKNCLKLEWAKEIMILEVGEFIKTEEKNTIVLYCPWSVPCLLESASPPSAQ